MPNWNQLLQVVNACAGRALFARADEVMEDLILGRPLGWNGARVSKLWHQASCGTDQHPNHELTLPTSFVRTHHNSFGLKCVCQTIDDVVWISFSTGEDVDGQVLMFWIAVECGVRLS